MSANKSRAQLHHVLLDVDFFEKPKIIALAEKLGQLAPLLLVRIYAAMSKATDAEIEVSCVEYLARVIGFTDVAEFLTYTIERGILCEGSKPFLITNSRVAQDQEKLAKAREDARIRQEKSRESRVTNALPTRFPDPATDPVTVFPLVEGGAGETKPKVEPVKKAFISSLDTEPCRNAAQRWRAHRHKQKLSFDDMALDALQAFYTGRPADFVNDIDYSISQNWRTVKPAPKEQARAGPAAPGRRNHDATIDAMKVILQECGHET